MKKTLLDKVSILVVTYKGDRLLKDCLGSLAATCGIEPQVVVVDNSPSEDTRAIVAKYENTRYIPSPGNSGFAGGNNRGIPYCDREYLLLLNNDTVVCKRESIERLVEFLDNNPQCAVACGSTSIPTVSGELSGGCGVFLTPFGFLYAKGAFQKISLDPHVNSRCFFDSGAFMMIRRGIIKRVGGFLFRAHFWAYYEEAEFCHRVWLSGNEVWHVDTPPIDHLCGKTAGLFPRADIMRRYLRNELFSLSANLGFAARSAIVPMLYTVIACCAFVHLLRGNGEMASAYIKSLAAPFSERGRIIAARRQAKRIRKVSDLAIFRRIMRFPSPSYILRGLGFIR